MPSGARMPPWVLRMRNSGPPSESGIPAHAGVLREAEEIAGGALAEHLVGEGNYALRTRRVGANLVDIGVVGAEQGG